MLFDSETLNFKAYAYKDCNHPVELVDESIQLVKSETGEGYTVPPNKILVKLHYASLNPVDIKMYRMAFAITSLINSKKGIGRDYCGEVVAAGSNTPVKVGDFISGLYFPLHAKGTVAQYLMLDTKKPDENVFTTVAKNLTLAESASWPLVLGTAIYMLDGLELPYKKVLVLGGATSVGRYVVQLLRVGASKEIVCTCSPRSENLLKEFGATSTIDYHTPNLANSVLESVKLSGEFDYIIDCTGGSHLFGNISSILRKGGTYNTVVGDCPGYSVMNLVCTFVKSMTRVIASKVGLIPYSYNFMLINSGFKFADQAKKYLQNEDVKVNVDHVFKFEEFKEALNKLESGNASGKIVIQIKED
ncbi:Protein YIM1 [Spathaspora sp. JA1]|nr:Protein YIM1 [Spathaspora sp. JA1]